MAKLTVQNYGQKKKSKFFPKAVVIFYFFLACNCVEGEKNITIAALAQPAVRFRFKRGAKVAIMTTRHTHTTKVCIQHTFRWLFEVP